MAFESLAPRSATVEASGLGHCKVSAVREEILRMFMMQRFRECDDHANSGSLGGPPLSIAFVVEPIRCEHLPLTAAHPLCRAWLTLQSQRGLARNTLEAYSRGLEVFLRFLAGQQLPIPAVTRAHIGAYLASMQSDAVAISNATVQQRITVLRLFYSHLVDEGLCNKNPLAHDPGRAFVRRYRRLPWIPNDADWQAILTATREGTVRNRTMLAFAYDAALRREELCGLRTDDIDPSHCILRIRAENTKGRRDRMVPYSATSDRLLQQYLFHRRALSRSRGPLFLSESRRNYAEPVSIWSWSKTVLAIARRAAVPRFSTHTLRHLCLTDLARAGWDIHEIAAFAGHRSVQTTLLYIHLSGRDLSRKLAAGMAHIHARRVAMLAKGEA
jgi:site-specific recombinase XerD